jgi:hypothetical protein
MIVIRTAEEMARALASRLTPEVEQIVRDHRDDLSGYEGYELTELALFIIVQPADRLSDIEASFGRPLVTVGGGVAAFALLPESIRQVGRCVEVVFVLSDAGFGLVLLIEHNDGTDPLLLEACQQALADMAGQPVE